MSGIQEPRINQGCVQNVRPLIGISLKKKNDAMLPEVSKMIEIRMNKNSRGGFYVGWEG